MISVLVNGAFGRMGSEVVRMVTANPELELAGGVDISAAGKTLPGDKPVFTNIAEALEAVNPDVVVDFTRPDVVMDSLRVILKKGVRLISVTQSCPADLTPSDKVRKSRIPALPVFPDSE